MAVHFLDTTVIVDVLNGKKGRGLFLENLLVQGNLLSCCSISVTEVYCGMRPHEAKATNEFLRSLRFYEVTWDVARLAGELQNKWKARGFTIALPDATIAAVAIANDLIFLTDNRKDFPMEELRFLDLPSSA